VNKNVIEGKNHTKQSQMRPRKNRDSPFNKGELKEKYNPPRRMRRMSDPKTKLAIEMGAEAFALNPVKPKRSILFALWTGEEKGLLGSRYYVNHLYFPSDSVEKVSASLMERIIRMTYLTAFDLANR
ncbi:MAG TPA: M28 family peptidase, partial [Acidobacteriota bacterium]|nr:M28 family peptidase [Acidobacteriota bacterium]